MSVFARRSSAFLAALAIAVAGAAWGEPARPKVVSMNLCTDQLAMLLADDGQLLSVTRVSADPLSSPMTETARQYPLNNGRAAEIFLMNPDVVVAGSYSDPVVVAMLRRLGLRVEQFPITSALSEIPAQIRRMGTVMGQADRAEAMARDAEARLASYPSGGDAGPLAAFFYANGYALGPGTLAHDIVTAAGFTNLSQTLGFSGGGRLPLETLVLNSPDVVISGQPYPGASRAEDVARHPVLARYFGAGRVILSGPEWVCGTPFTLDAVDRLIAARRALN